MAPGVPPAWRQNLCELSLAGVPCSPPPASGHLRHHQHAPQRVTRQHSKVAVPMLARRWYQCPNPIQKLTFAQPHFNRSLLLLLRHVPLQRRPLQPVAHLRPAHTSRSPANIGRAQYRNSRSRPALSCAATRTRMHRKSTAVPHPCIAATVALLSNPRISNNPSTRCLTSAYTRSTQASSTYAYRFANHCRTGAEFIQHIRANSHARSASRQSCSSPARHPFRLPPGAKHTPTPTRLRVKFAQ